MVSSQLTVPRRFETTTARMTMQWQLQLEML
jgi:hypothetical protein